MKVTHFWINKKMESVDIEDMDDMYLYNIIKMIWNNMINPSNPFGEVIKWDFHQPHSPEYLVNFFQIGYFKLKNRNLGELAKTSPIKEFIKHVGDIKFS